MIRLILFIFALSCQILYASDKNITLDLQDANLSDTIRLMAKFANKNVIISPLVNGSVSLHLKNEIPDKAFALLLLSQGLSKWEAGQVWYIASQEELIKHQQENIKWQQLQEDTAMLATKLWQIHYSKAQDLVALLMDEHGSLLSRRGFARADNRTNSIYIRDLPEYIEKVGHIIKQLDIPVKQIVIEARLLSIDHDFERELGIDFSVAPSSAKSLLSEMSRYSIAVAKLADGSLLDVKLAALEKTGHARLISSPSLYTANQQTASIEAGEEIPYQEISESGGTAVVFKKAVLGLKVTPQILPGNNVLLQMQINQDRPSNKMVQGVPTISTREILTNVLVRSGKTVVLGGIYEADQENGMQRLPFLGHIPLIGVLFSQVHALENKRELLIFVTPRVITQDI